VTGIKAMSHSISHFVKPRDYLAYTAGAAFALHADFNGSMRVRPMAYTPLDVCRSRPRKLVLELETSGPVTICALETFAAPPAPIP
jgi:hypothetical protein